MGNTIEKRANEYRIKQIGDYWAVQFRAITVDFRYGPWRFSAGNSKYYSWEEAVSGMKAVIKLRTEHRLISFIDRGTREEIEATVVIPKQ